MNGNSSRNVIGRKFKTLEEIYSVLPKIDCCGKCADTCTALPMSQLERERIAEHGVLIPLIDGPLAIRWQDARCPALTELNRCSVHEVRPLICRMYGVVLDIACKHGCKVHGDMLTAEEGHWLLDEARRLGGGSTVTSRWKKKSRK